MKQSQTAVGNALPGVPNRDDETGQAGTGTHGTLVPDGASATVSPATSLPVQAGVALRRRFQKGTLIVRGKTPVRCGVYREDVLQANGTFKRVQRCVVLGPVSSLSERAAWKRFQPYLDRVNAAAKLPPKTGKTLEQFVQEWRSSVAVTLKGSTVRAYESHLRAHILPKLGSLPLTEINTKAVQAFVAHLSSGGRSRKTVENVLMTLSSLCRTAKSWEYACGSWSLADLTMPREGVRKEARCFTDEEMRKMISNAPEPLSTILAVTAVLGLRIRRDCCLSRQRHRLQTQNCGGASER